LLFLLLPLLVLLFVIPQGSAVAVAVACPLSVVPQPSASLQKNTSQQPKTPPPAPENPYPKFA
jgi:hypothetical protein